MLGNTHIQEGNIERLNFQYTTFENDILCCTKCKILAAMLPHSTPVYSNNGEYCHLCSGYYQYYPTEPQQRKGVQINMSVKNQL